MKSASPKVFNRESSISNEAVRSNNRKKRIIHAAASSAAARGVNVASGLITVPLTYPYLGPEQFGIWMALTSLVALLSFGDFGLSIGLQSALSKCSGKSDKETPAYLVSTSLLLILIISLLIIFFAFHFLPLVELDAIVKVDSQEDMPILLGAAQATLVAFAVCMPAVLIQRIFEAYQEGRVANILLTLGRILGLIGVYISVHLGLSLPNMIAWYMVAPYVLVFCGGGWLFWKKKWLRPSLRKFSFKHLAGLSKVGGLALFAQIGATLMSSGPLLVLTSKYGASAIVPFAIAHRLVGGVSMVISVVLNPLWPAYGEACARGDWAWVFSTFRKSLLWSLYAGLPAFLMLAVFGQEIIRIWVGAEEAIPDWGLLMVCSVWSMVLILTRVFSMCLNGLAQFSGQAVYGVIFPLLALFLGAAVSEHWPMIYSLMVMIVVGEVSKVMFMAWELKSVFERAEYSAGVVK